jgi:hypothetical protein
MEDFQTQVRSLVSDQQPEKSGWESSWDLQLILHSKTPNGQILISGDLLLYVLRTVARTRAQWHGIVPPETIQTCQPSQICRFKKNFGSRAFLASGGLVPNERVESDSHPPRFAALSG